MHVPVTEEVLGCVELIDVVYPGFLDTSVIVESVLRKRHWVPLRVGVGEYEGVVCVETYYADTPSYWIYVPQTTTQRASDVIQIFRDHIGLEGTPQVEGYTCVRFEGTRMDLTLFPHLVFPEVVVPYTLEGLSRMKTGGSPVLVPPKSRVHFDFALIGGIPSSSDVWVAFLRIVPARVRGRMAHVTLKRPLRYTGYTTDDYVAGLRGGYLRTRGLLRVRGALLTSCGCRLSAGGLCRLCVVKRLDALSQVLSDDEALGKAGAYRIAEDEMGVFAPPSEYPRVGFIYD